MQLIGEMDPSMPLAQKIEMIMRSAVGRMSLAGLHERPGMEQHELADIRAAVMAEVNDGNVAEFVEPGARTLYQWTGPQIMEAGVQPDRTSDGLIIGALLEKAPLSMVELCGRAKLSMAETRAAVARLMLGGRVLMIGSGRWARYCKPEQKPAAPDASAIVKALTAAEGPRGAPAPKAPAGSNGAPKELRMALATETDP